MRAFPSCLILIFVAASCNAQDFCPQRPWKVNDSHMPEFCTMFQILITRINSEESQFITCNDKENEFLNEKLEFYVSEFARSFFRANDLRLNSPLSGIGSAQVTANPLVGNATLPFVAEDDFTSSVNITAESSLLSNNISLPTLKPSTFPAETPLTLSPSQLNGQAFDDDFTILTLSNQSSSAPTNKIESSLPTESPNSILPPNSAPSISQIPNLIPPQFPTKTPTSRPTNHPSNRPTIRPTNRPTNRPTIQPTIQPTEKLSKKSEKSTAKDAGKQPSATPTPKPTPTKSKRKLKSDRLMLRGTFIWGGSSSWTCRSCWGDKWDNRRRTLQGVDNKEIPYEVLEAFMSEKLTAALETEVALIMEETSEVGCLGSGDSHRVHFQVVTNVA